MIPPLSSQSNQTRSVQRNFARQRQKSFSIPDSATSDNSTNPAASNSVSSSAVSTTSIEKQQDLKGLTTEDIARLQKEYNIQNLSYEEYLDIVNFLEEKGAIGSSAQILEVGDSKGYDPYAGISPSCVIVTYPGDARVPEVSTDRNPYTALRENVAYSMTIIRRVIEQDGEFSDKELLERYQYQEEILNALDKIFPDAANWSKFQDPMTSEKIMMAAKSSNSVSPKDMYQQMKSQAASIQIAVAEALSRSILEKTEESLLFWKP